MTTQDEIEIRRLVEAKAEGVRARDPKAMVEGYAAEVVVYNLAPPLRQPDDARNTGPVEQWLSTFDGPMSVEVRDLDVTVGGDVAYCTGLSCLTATPRGAQDSFTLWYRTTLGLQKIGGAWRITHEHESVPFEMDGSMRASLNLQP
jgi:ketosteroid isomerase-like protein